MVNKLATPPLRPKLRPRTKTDEKTLRGRSVFIDETGDITGAKGTRYSEVTTTIPWGTEWITAPTIDKDGSKLSDEEVARRLKTMKVETLSQEKNYQHLRVNQKLVLMLSGVQTQCLMKSR